MMQRNCETDNSNNNATTHQACASCKHQRKRCSNSCVLAPYFPAYKSKEFQAVHRVFGVSNVQKMVRTVREEDRTRLSESLTWEALWRQKDPVMGLYGEYRRIYEELKLYKGLVVHHQHLINSWDNNNNNNNGIHHVLNNTNHNNKTGLLVDYESGSGGLMGLNHINNNGVINSNNNGGWGKFKQERQQCYGVAKQHYSLSHKF